jgi:SAM-dependent methyltransferase
MSLISQLLNQFRKPTGWLGRLTLREMNRHHCKLTDWGLTHIAIEQHDTILEVGCGGGRTVHKLAGTATDGKVYGIDFSEASVSFSRRTNLFDLVSAVETHLGYGNDSYEIGPLADLRFLGSHSNAKKQPSYLRLNLAPLAEMLPGCCVAIASF